MFPIISLPEKTSSEEIIKKVLWMHGFTKREIKNLKILEVREVHIKNGTTKDLYNAALIQIDTSQEVILFRYESPEIGWWSRVISLDRNEHHQKIRFLRLG